MKRRSNTSTPTSGIWSRRFSENSSTERKTMFKGSLTKSALAMGAIAVMATSFCQHGVAADKKRKVEIRAKGSDTMIQLATAWAEAYRKVKPNVFVNANGGGTGTGFAALQNNTTDICNASREIKKDEAEKTKAVTGKAVKEFVAAYDALAVYVHPSNPIKEISVEELREIWAEGGNVQSWEQLNPA